MMKFLILSLIISILICCKSPQQIGHNQSIDTIISMNEMIEIIDTLSCDAFEGRKTGSEGIEKAAKYIENYFRKFNIRSFYSNYRDSFLIGEIQAYNIIGIIEGKNPDLINEYILLSAHYDHIGKSFGDSDSVYNGANDNASGVSTVLNIARILAENPQNSRNIIIALFSGEEMGLLGSEHFARILKKNGPKLYCAVNVDMIGSQFSKDPGKVYLSGYKKSNMPEIFNRYIGSEEVVQWSKEDMYDLFSLSDNYHSFSLCFQSLLNLQQIKSCCCTAYVKPYLLAFYRRCQTL